MHTTRIAWGWNQTDAGTRRYYLYDGSDPVCELNSSGTVIAVNTFGANGLVSRTLPTFGTTFYAFDERGNVAHRVNSSGTVLNSDLYDAFGKPRSGASDVFGFGDQAGYYTDKETALHGRPSFLMALTTHYSPAMMTAMGIIRASGVTSPASTCIRRTRSMSL